MVGGEDQQWLGPCKRSGATLYYSFLLPTSPGPGGGRQHNPKMTEADAKMEVGENSSEVKQIEDK